MEPTAPATCGVFPGAESPPEFSAADRAARSHRVQTREPEDLLTTDGTRIATAAAAGRSTTTLLLPVAYRAPLNTPRFSCVHARPVRPCFLAHKNRLTHPVGKQKPRKFHAPVCLRRCALCSDWWKMAIAAARKNAFGFLQRGACVCAKGSRRGRDQAPDSPAPPDANTAQTPTQSPQEERWAAFMNRSSRKPRPEPGPDNENGREQDFGPCRSGRLIFRHCSKSTQP